MLLSMSTDSFSQERFYTRRHFDFFFLTENVLSLIICFLWEISFLSHNFQGKFIFLAFVVSLTISCLYICSSFFSFALQDADSRAERERKNQAMVTHPRQASLPLCSVIVTLYYCCRYHYGEPEVHNIIYMIKIRTIIWCKYVCDDLIIICYCSLYFRASSPVLWLFALDFR